MLITSGYNFEGYDIVEYFGHASAQVVLGTGFFSSTSAAVADIFGTTSNSYEAKLDQAEQIGKARLMNKAVQNGCNAIIGLDVDYTTFSNDVMGVIVGGTLVKVTKQISNRKSKCFINSNYNLFCGIRCLESTLSRIGEDKVYLHVNGKKYFQEPLNAIEATVNIKTIFGKEYTIDNIMFADIEEYNDIFYSECVLLDNLCAKDYKLIQSVGIVIKKYVSLNKIFDIDIEQNLESSLSETALKALRNSERIDAVQFPYRNKNNWYCCCGKENPLSTDTCQYCKQNVKIENLKYILEDNTEETASIHEKIAYATSNYSTAKEIYEYLLTINSDSEIFYNEILPRIKRIQANERVYGNSKEDVIKVFNEYHMIS